MMKKSLYSKNYLGDPSGLSKYLVTAAFVIILLLGVALRFYNLGAESYWIDEVFTVFEGRQSLGQIIMSGRLDQPPAYYVPFHYWVRVFGSSEAGTRSFSALAGIGSIILVYLIGREICGKAVGLIAAFLTTISIYQIYYSQEARYYSYFEFMVLLSFFFLILALKSKRIIHFILYGIASVLMVYSHTFGVFMLVAQNLFLALRLNKYKSIIGIWLFFQAWILLAMLPIFYLLLFRDNGVGGAIASNIAIGGNEHVPEPLHIMYRFILPARYTYGYEIVHGSYVAAGIFFLIGVLIFVLWQGMGGWTNLKKGVIADLWEAWGMADGLALFLCWLLCPILLPYILSLTVSTYLYAERYMVGASPALYLFLALGIFSMRKLVPIIVSLGVMTILILPSLGQYYSRDLKEQWKETAGYVDENSSPGDMIVFAPVSSNEIQRKAFYLYYQGSLPYCGLDIELTDDAAILKSLRQCVSGYDRFWLILPDYPETNDPHMLRYRSFFLNSKQIEMRLVKEEQFNKISVYLFDLTK